MRGGGYTTALTNTRDRRRARAFGHTSNLRATMVGGYGALGMLLPLAMVVVVVLLTVAEQTTGGGGGLRPRIGRGVLGGRRQRPNRMRLGAMESLQLRLDALPVLTPREQREEAEMLRAMGRPERMSTAATADRLREKMAALAAAAAAAAAAAETR